MNIFLSAGDPSGDIAASRVLTALKKQHDSIRVFGLGGEKLRELGQRQLAEQNQLAVLGFWEVAKRYPFFRKLFYQCLDEVDRQKPACAVLVDYPGFNLRLAKELKKRHIPVIYYIAPQVWAWGESRISQIRERVDLLLLALPFEQQFFAATGIKCEFVGHYLLEDIPRDLVSSPVPDSNMLALLPGSRFQEIDRMLPPMLEAAKLYARQTSASIKIAAIKGRYDYETLVGSEDDNVDIVYGDSRRVIYESQLALVASGTATLETAIIGRPMVVVYKTSWLTYQIARRVVELDAIALVNLTAGKQIVPELIQNDMTPERVAAELQTMKSRSAEVREQLSAIPKMLGGEGASERVAAAILRACTGKN